MWTRAELKERAKEALRGTYWKAFLVSIVVGMFSGSGGGSSGGSSSGSFFYNIGGMNKGFDFVMIGVILIIILIVMIIAICLRVFIGYPLEVGGSKYFISSANGDADLSYLGYSFKSGIFFDIIKTMFYKGILIFLWTLLFIIPGIVKSYAYRMVPYILAENPNIGYKRAVELSNSMTYGEKFDIFILDLSFIGWYLLGFLACFIGMIFIPPYQMATNAELYLELRNKALETGLCTHQELNLVQEL